MKFLTDKNRDAYQRLIEKEIQLKVELKQLEQKIEDYETRYLERTWNDGNIVLGWSKIVVPPPPHGTAKIVVSPKDKIFSLSSTTSSVNLELEEIVDKNLAPFPENRFQTTKKRSKKSKIQASSKKRIIRRRRR